MVRSLAPRHLVLAAAAMTLALSTALSTLVLPAQAAQAAGASTRTYTYKICYRGAISTSRTTFARTVTATYADARGWRRAGITFTRKNVSCGTLRNTDVTVYLAAPSYVGSFSGCSTRYSCRVGRRVMINLTRWKYGVAHWPASLGLTGYRQMVLNHEIGHWLGRGHRRCAGPGRTAPVMQQQSKRLSGCKANPWPKDHEISSASSTRP
jgi:hypothetical protein